MSLRINQNIDAFNSYRNLSVTQGQMSKSLEKLSSGFRINRAADDAAGLAISEGLRSQVSGIKVAVRNAQDGVSVVQTAEGALTETHSILQRMRDLAVQASNDGALNADAKKNIQDEVDQLKTELTRIATTTEFNGTKLLDGNYTGTFQVGAKNTDNDRIQVKIGDLGTAGLGLQALDVTGDGTAAVTPTVTGATLDDGTGTAAGAKAVFGGADYSAGTAGANDAAAVENFKKLNGTLTIDGKSFDLASVDYSNVTTSADAVAALNAALADAFGPNAPTAAVDGTSFELEITSAVPAAGTSNADLAKLDMAFTAPSGANQAIDLLDAAIKDVSSVRSELGAIQNRFEHTIANLNVTQENLSASESRIRDTDMASEMMNFTRAQILSQAGTAMLAQANSAPQGVLQLLRG